MVIELTAQCSYVGCWLLAVGCWLLAVGCWLLAVGCWRFEIWMDVDFDSIVTCENKFTNH